MGEENADHHSSKPAPFVDQEPDPHHVREDGEEKQASNSDSGSPLRPEKSFKILIAAITCFQPFVHPEVVHRTTVKIVTSF